ncbi:hypothetical protein A0J48_007030 [Sphaerospermopsis aphanizomenoides BCCUSP55]|uniref:hypothetical protein n=1 Tax=Sphaerospermopsis aphanizomenoides TaxID=459663 RepID=UPI00190757F5|nr:hypothetical protein [Sphaerospermopsis aphanizomenoides]MBK1987290.1 hypothetical protein [Sphaerospermopsis aphanizomenoides BCCUSP55]
MASEKEIKRSKGKFDPVKELRYWLPAASEEHCKKIGAKRGLRLIETIDTEADVLPIICIFEGYPDE